MKLKTLLILSASIMLLLLCSTSCNRRVDIYVSPLGSDQSDGSIKQPVKSLQKAKTLAQEHIGSKSVTIHLREGVHQLTEPLVHTSAQFGAASKSLQYVAYEGEKPIVSGSVILPNLKWEDYREGIKKAHIEDDLHMASLYVDGEKQPMARYPNFDKNIRHFNGYAADAISPDRVKSWANPIGGIIHAMHSAEWGGYQYEIKGKKSDQELELIGGFQNNRQMGMHKEFRMVENIFEELDTVGEWYYNKSEKTLYYYPPQGADLGKLVFESPQTETLFEMRGSIQEPVTDISIIGLELRQTLPTFMKTNEPLLRSDWMIHRGGAILMDGVSNCRVSECDIHQIGGNAIFVSNYARRVDIENNHVHNIGASGVCFVGSPSAVRSPSFEYRESVPYADQDTEPGPKTDEYPMECLVDNNLIHDMGLIEKQGAGVQISMSRRITVSQNSIYNLPRSGINISEGTWGGHMIEGNDVFNTVLETGDHGSFNSWGRDRFWSANRAEMDDFMAKNPDYPFLDAMETTTIANNRWQCFHGWDIDLDDGSSNYRIVNNLCLNGGLKLREGFGRTVENNVILNNSFHPHVWFKNSNDVFRHNIVTRGYYPIGITDWGSTIDQNLFPDASSLALAQKENTDSNSAFGYPQFLDTIKGDYRVEEATSPAIAIGFKNFDMTNFGVQYPPLKAMRQEPVLPTLTFPSESVPEEQLTMTWLDAELRTMTSEGERSATGMSKVSGVMVSKLAAGSSLAKAGVRENDVITAIEGVEVSSCADLQKELPRVGQQKSIEVLIFQNQKPKLVSVVLNK